MLFLYYRHNWWTAAFSCPSANTFTVNDPKRINPVRDFLSIERNAKDNTYRLHAIYEILLIHGTWSPHVDHDSCISGLIIHLPIYFVRGPIPLIKHFSIDRKPLSALNTFSFTGQHWCWIPDSGFWINGLHGLSASITTDSWLLLFWFPGDRMRFPV